MGKLTSYLQQEFSRRSPIGWECLHETPLLHQDLESLLGYSSRADVVLQRRDSSRRLWIEFEVSRADPVANHAKFATSHLFQPQAETDVFISMVSSHVQRGRRNLAANAIALMRQVGMSAFQTLLFPQLSPSEIKRINHLQISEILAENLDIESEIERALLVSEAVLEASDCRIHFAGDLMEVFLNLRRWNQDLETVRGKDQWGKRTITYFVYDPYSAKFAPSKFCAYVALPHKTNLGEITIVHRSEMTVDLYITLDGTDGRFDGRRAQSHLTKNLGMILVHAEYASDTMLYFKQWLKQYSHSVTVHPKGPIFLLSPWWFT